MIDVAVIARRGAPLLDAALGALRDAGAAEPRVLYVGPDGPATARNVALLSCTAEVLALVEDDVVVAPGWLAALREAWTAAGDDVAVIGGPLAPMVEGPAPTYPGGNVSFRAAALRGAGGFWPARGRAGQRDWFSEEHEAQRELARIGWRAEFAAGAAARRGAEPGLGERLRSGARRQALGEPRSRATALRGVAAGLAGAPLGRSRERLGRAAENVGVLLGPRVVRRELRPTARATPFRPSVPAPARGGRLRRSRGRRRPTVLLYHRIAAPDTDPLGLAVTPAHWAAQLDVLRSTRRIVPLEAVAAGQAGPRDVAITFDDGYRDNLALAGAGVPITLFAATGAIAAGGGWWWDAIERLCRERAGERVRVEDRAFVLGPVARGYLHQWLQPRPPGEIAAVLEALRAPPGDRALTVDELRGLAAAGVTVGAHSRTHRSLRHAAPDEQRAEIEGSRDDLTGWLGAPPAAFSYPFGVPGDAFDDVAVRIVREAGFGCAVANAPDPGADRFSIARRTAPDVGAEDFARWLDRAERRGR